MRRDDKGRFVAEGKHAGEYSKAEKSQARCSGEFFDVNCAKCFPDYYPRAAKHRADLAEVKR